MILIAALFASPVQAQAPEKKPNLSEEAAVIEQSLSKASFEADGTSVRESTKRVRIQSDAGVQVFGILSVGYQKAFEEAEIVYVRVYKPDGAIVTTPLDDIQDIEAEITREAPFYSDLREKHIAVKGLGVGDVLEWQTRQRTIKPIAPGHFWCDYEFLKQIIVLDEQFQLSVPRDAYVNVKSPELKPKIHDEGNRRIYEWKRAQLDHQEDEKEKFQTPFRGPQPDIQVSSFHSWDEVGRWYDSLQRDRIAPSPEVRAKAIELTRNATTEEEKTRILYTYVATQFRYIGVAFGIGRYQPHTAADVLSNSYGDCKDKHTLLASLLQAVGVEAWPALISSRLSADPDVPTPAQFDHVITVLHRGKELVWLDTTAEVGPFGFLLMNLRDKQALVIPPNAPASLMKTPVDPPFASYQKFHMTATLNDDGELKGKVEQEYRGDAEVLFRAAFRRLPQPRWKDLVQNISYSLGYGGTVADVSSSKPDLTTEPFHLSYQYDRKDYSDWKANKRISPTPSLSDLPDLSEEHEKSGAPLFLGSPIEVLYTTEIRIPKGYKPELPKDVDLTTDLAEYHAKYSLVDDVVKVEQRLRTRKNEISSAQYSAYKDFRRKVSDDESSWITFTSASTSTENRAADKNEATNNSWPKLPDTAAAHMYSDGADLMRKNDLRAALDKFEKAAKLDPKLPGVWYFIGTIKISLQQTEQGLDAMRRQTKETPDVPMAYKGFSSYLMWLHRPEEALPVLQQLNKIAPDDRAAPVSLGNCLFILKRYKEASSSFETAAKLNPKSAFIYLMLGKSYLETDDSDKAYSAFAKAVSLDNEYSSMRNDAAYSLAEHKIHLHEAQLWAEQAVKNREDDTRNLNGKQFDSGHTALMSQLAAYWDTLGWVYFQNGDYKGAEPYLRAAWWMGQGSTEGYHLAQTYEKLDEAKNAAHFYAFSAASPDPLPSAEARTRLYSMLGVHAAESAIASAREELGKMRTIHLAKLPGRKGTAEFLILFTNNGEEGLPAQPAKSAESDKTSEDSKPINAAQFADPGAVSHTEKPPKPLRPSVEQVRFISGSEELHGLEEQLRKTNFEVPFPDHVLTKIVRRGLLNCGAYSKGCDFVLLTADHMRNPN